MDGSIQFVLHYIHNVLLNSNNKCFIVYYELKYDLKCK